MEENTITVKKPLHSIGFKPTENYFHGMLRIVLGVIIVALIGLSLYLNTQQKNETVQLGDVEDVIQPGTKMHKIINEMNGEAQATYLAAIKHAIDSRKKSKLSKFGRTVLVALFSSMIAEYITNGDPSKSVGIVGKTTFIASITSMLT